MLATKSSGVRSDHSHTRMLIVSENPEIEIDLIYQLLRIAVKIVA